MTLAVLLSRDIFSPSSFELFVCNAKAIQIMILHERTDSHTSQGMTLRRKCEKHVRPCVVLRLPAVEIARREWHMADEGDEGEVLPSSKD
jgi:hypothetical protein